MAMKGVIVCVFILSFFRFGSATYCVQNNDCDTWRGESCCSDNVCRRNCYYCSYNSDCGTGEECCAGGEFGGDCRSFCPTTNAPSTYAKYCTFNSDCGLDDVCCDGECLAVCPSTSAPWTLATRALISYCTFDSDCGLDDVCCNGDCLAVCPSTWTAGDISGAVCGTIVFFSIIFYFVACYYCAWCRYYRYRSPGAVIVAGQVPYQPFVTSTHTTVTQNVPQPPNYNQPPPPGCQPPPYSGYPQQLAQYPPAPVQATGQPSLAPKTTA